MNDEIPQRDEGGQSGDLGENDILPLRSMAPTVAIPSPGSRSITSLRPAALRKRSSRLSKYGVSFQPPQDDAIHYPSDAKELSFFEKVISYANLIICRNTF